MNINIETIISISALIIAGFSAFLSHRSTKLAEIANNTTKQVAQNSSELTKEMFRRQNVIDLHLAWRGVNEINPNEIITPDVILAVNALDLTASIWNHDIVKKDIILQSYWRSYSELYETIYNCNELMPGLKKTCRELIRESPAISTAYESMKKIVNSQTITTNLNKENQHADATRNDTKT